MSEQQDGTVYEKICNTRKTERCTAVDYINNIISGFTELHGDRRFGDDHAVVGGIGKLCGEPVTVIGIEKGHTAYERMYRDFGCVLPEGYRKALRLIKEAEKFDRPVVCFVDTQGANCGKGAEERGEGSAIAENLYEISGVKTPIITVMVGEGGSGGALALAVADEVWMLENAYYSVISPEACASIIYKDATKAPEVAEHLKLTARDLYGFGVIERVVEEPEDFKDKAQVQAFMRGLQKDLYKKIKSLQRVDEQTLINNRYQKYRKIGSGEEERKKGGRLHRG